MLHSNEYIIGIDLSINSTGITVLERGGPVYHFLVVDKMKKTMDAYKRFPNDFPLTIIQYSKYSLKDAKDSKEKELFKSKNIYNISNKIIEIIEYYHQIGRVLSVRIEGISFGSTSTNSLMELAGLNYTIRLACLANDIDLIIVPPTELKSKAVGIGRADKDVMVHSFLQIMPHMSQIPKNIKLDDIADSYFLCMFDNTM